MYLPKKKINGAIGISMIETIETLNPSFLFPFFPSRHQHKTSRWSQFPAMSDAEFAAAVMPETYQNDALRQQPVHARHKSSLALMVALLATLQRALQLLRVQRALLAVWLLAAMHASRAVGRALLAQQRVLLAARCSHSNVCCWPLVAEISDLDSLSSFSSDNSSAIY